MAEALPFHASTYEIKLDHAARASLLPIDGKAAKDLADRIVRIDPWRTLETDRVKLAEVLIETDHASFRRAIVHNGECIGVVSVRNPWLFGPYLALLAVFPEHQRIGVGSGVLGWLETEVEASASNIWACVSSFNERARSFYRTHGFQEVGQLPDLVRGDFSEVLIRKQLVRSALR